MSTTEATTSHPTTTTQSTTTQDTTTMSTLEATTSHPTTTTQSTTTQDTTTMSTLEATTSHPTTTTQSTTTQDTITMSTLEATTSHPTTTTQSTTTQDTITMSTIEATTSHPTTTTQSTTTQDTTPMSTMDTTTSHRTTTTQSTTTEDTITMSTIEATTSHPTTTTPSTAKIFVTDESTENKIFVAYLRDDLVFTSIPSTKEPRYITYDSVEKKIYWTDKDTKRVYRADEDGGNREAVTSESGDELRGIAIDETSRILYIANKSPKKITYVSIAQGSSFPRDETPFTTEFSEELYSVEVDEEKGFLYWSVNDEILRRPLDKSSGRTTVYQNDDLSKITGLSIDLSRDPRRMFFCDFAEEIYFYQDIDTGSLPVIIPGTSGEEKLRDVSYFNGDLYWTKDDSQRGIAVLTNYGKSSPLFDIKETSEIKSPFQLVITDVERDIILH
eukprot:XP_011674501.1 PREDICTED: low-density lipoprotein receptor-related protein 5-like [Strongylocentrotus purpuratus]